MARSNVIAAPSNISRSKMYSATVHWAHDDLPEETLFRAPPDIVNEAVDSTARRYASTISPVYTVTKWPSIDDSPSFDACLAVLSTVDVDTLDVGVHVRTLPDVMSVVLHVTRQDDGYIFSGANVCVVRARVWSTAVEKYLSPREVLRLTASVTTDLGSAIAAAAAAENVEAAKAAATEVTEPEADAAKFTKSLGDFLTHK